MWKSSVAWSAVLVLMSHKNGLTDHCSISWSCSSCTLSNLTGTTQICPDVKIFQITKILKWKNISYSAFCTAGLNVDICLGCTPVWIFFCIWCQNCSCHYRKGMLSGSTKEICKFTKISYQWLALLNAPLSWSNPLSHSLPHKSPGRSVMKPPFNFNTVFNFHTVSMN